MEAGNLLRSVPLNPHISSGHRLPTFRQFVRVSANLQGGYRGPRPKRELIAEWVSNNDDAVRSMPIYVGGISLFAVLFNRTISGIAPVADASSSQSRADLLTIGLAVTNILAGLVWLSIRPKTISVVPPRGVECERIHSNVPDLVASELIWAWESLSAMTCSRSLVIVYDDICVLQIGCASAASSNEGEPLVVDADKLMQGSIYQGVVKSGSQSYLANLSLYPGKSELPFLPSNTQAVILQPLGDKGIAILGGDTIRGFTASDQAWITLIGEKLDATLSKRMTSIPLASGRAR
ncbi:protein COFACTOR ASSEMBLY OF COMPLEX C SUBUNIT B CCB4, chloroplastic isoform X1 [Cynara cardunculus var. scolymus]|uniref:protein COFACTOR ASSEMBLY OF COMPLEX C SUBUNIT B CCB4, chloroplastic isoform X1 n=1 Tax=Cynara cardunculus var. scolymus TaxID=59895 RepID=UPI000D62BBC9|nr:protein COFACTOR ASSEMBLY OF COMPLEX C SUBUNIT B CCB4, chloroplastic isoform X1 [Cynara cardunculus var. scolymus]